MPRRPQRRLPLSARMRDGRIYRKSGTSPAGIIYLRCQKSTVCQGTAKIVDDMIQELNPHSIYCLPDHQAEFNARFKQALREALSRHWYRLKDLYDTLAAVHPEAAQNMSFRSVRSYMKRCRRTLFPPHPQNIREFVERLLDPQYERNLEYDTGRLSVKLITDDRGADHALLYDENFVETEMREVCKLMIDGTFRSTPSIQDAYQLVTLIGIKYNHGFPFIWIVMSRKTEAACAAVFRYVKEHIIPNANIRLAMSDFERALRNAIVEVFPTAHSTGCNVHYDRALYQKAKSIGLQNILRYDEDAKLFFKKILALAYLPANLIEAQYNRLKNELLANLKRRFRAFMQYYNRYWLNIVRPHGFSVYGLGRRTNNIIESYHSRLGHRMEAHPAAWDFVCKLLKLQSQVKADVQRLRNNQQIGRHPRYETIFKQKQLVRAWRELHMRSISVDEFMEKAASLKGHVAEIVAREANGREGVDFELQEAPIAIPLENDPDYEQQLFADEPPHWLLDNAEHAILPRPNDVSDNESRGDGTDSSGDESSEEEIPNAIEEEIEPAHHFEIGENNEGHQVPANNFEEDIQPAQIVEVVDNDGGRQTPPDNIFDHFLHGRENIQPAEIVEVVDNDDGPQVPPANAFEADIQPAQIVEVVENDGGRRTPQAVAIGRGNRARRRNEQPVAPAQPGSSRNKRRLEMRKKAKRRAAQSREEETRAAVQAEIAQLRNELVETQDRLNRQAAAQAQIVNERRVAVDNDCFEANDISAEGYFTVAKDRLQARRRLKSSLNYLKLV